MTALPRVPGAGADPPAGRRGIRVGPVALRWRTRTVLVCTAAAIALVVVLLVSAGVGDVPLAPNRVLPALLGLGDPGAAFVVQQLRLPRVLVGLLVGAALAAAGALTQTVARNPLASPDVLGVTAGASAAAVALILLGGGAAGELQPASAAVASVGVPGVALAGGLGTAALVLLLAGREPGHGSRLLLVGIGVGALAKAAVSWLLVGAQVDQAARAAVWLTGSLDDRGWDQVLPLLVAVALLLPAAVLLGFPLDVVLLGDDTAVALGASAARTAVLAVLTAVGLAAVAVAAAGPIAFVALVAPQIALRLIRSARPPIVLSALLGALLLTGSDLVSRTALPVPLPVGLVTAAIGAPYFLHLLARRNRRATA